MLTMIDLLDAVANALTDSERTFWVRYADVSNVSQNAGGCFVEPAGIFMDHSSPQRRTLNKGLSVYVVVEKLLSSVPATSPIPGVLDNEINRQIRLEITALETMMRGFLPGTGQLYPIDRASCQSVAPIPGFNGLYSLQSSENETPYFVGGFQANFITLS